jgi:hypothetical protein
MRWIGAVVIAVGLLAACEPEPGETRCSTIPIAGTAITRCRTAPEAPRGFWCTTRDDGFGVCSLASNPSACESWRTRATDAVYAPCEFRRIAVCAPTGCFPTPAACVEIERRAGRSGSDCTTQ